MGSVGLLYVGAVLFINGLMLLGVVPGKSAAIMNFFVGTMQIVFPTITILQADGDSSVIFGAAGLYLFGFTYLYVGINQIAGISGEGLGWFSLFVTICAVVIGVLQFAWLGDPVFGALWFSWAVLWFMFFLLLSLYMDSIRAVTGWFTIFVSFFTGTIPALLLLSGGFESTNGWALVVGMVALVSLAASFLLRQVPRPRQAAVVAA